MYAMEIVIVVHKHCLSLLNFYEYFTNIYWKKSMLITHIVTRNLLCLNNISHQLINMSSTSKLKSAK